MFISPSELDESVTEWMVEHRAEPWVSLAQAVTLLGNTLVMTALTALAVIGLWLARRRVEAVFVGAAVLSGYALMQALKYSFGRTRPPLEDRLLNIDTFSYPSGHAMMTMIVFGVMAVAAYRCSAWVRAHRWILVVAPVCSIVVGLTRIVLTVHWVTDVVSGWLFGIAWVALWVWGLGRYDARRARAGDVTRLDSA